MNTIESADTATPHRDSIIKLLYQAYWSDPGQDTANIKWLRDMYQDVYAATGGVPVSNEVTDGCYINYADIDLNSPEFNRSSSHGGSCTLVPTIRACSRQKRGGIH